MEPSGGPELKIPTKNAMRGHSGKISCKRNGRDKPFCFWQIIKFMLG